MLSNGKALAILFIVYKDSMRTKMRFIRLLYILILLSVCAPVSAYAKTDTRQVTGKITDKATGLPVVGATVSIPDLKIGTSTDANGNFTLKQLPRGRYLIQ